MKEFSRKPAHAVSIWQAPASSTKGQGRGGIRPTTNEGRAVEGVRWRVRGLDQRDGAAIALRNSPRNEKKSFS